MPVASFDSIYKTHLNYIKCIEAQFAAISLSTSLAPTAGLPTSGIDRFQKLADLTKQSIDNEISACSIAHEYAQIIVTWLPVKCYYRLYYLESVLVYLLNGNQTGFTRGGHKGVRKAISNLINANQLIFSNVEVSTQTTIMMIRAHRIASGANLSATYYTSPDCINSVRKKISEYQEHDWKEGRGIRAYITAASRASRDNFYATNTLNLTDFFYWMRIKVNYKDLDFPALVATPNAYMSMPYTTSQHMKLCRRFREPNICSESNARHICYHRVMRCLISSLVFGVLCD